MFDNKLLHERNLLFYYFLGKLSIEKSIEINSVDKLIEYYEKFNKKENEENLYETLYEKLLEKFEEYEMLLLYILNKLRYNEDANELSNLSIDDLIKN